MAQLIKPILKPMKGFSLFKRYFAQTTNDFSVAGSRLMNDGSGEVNFRAALFQDNMNAAAINTKYWRVTQTGTMVATPVVGKGILMSWIGGGSAGDKSELTFKNSYGRINETGFIRFTLKTCGFGTGSGMDGFLQVDDGESTAKIEIGMYFDENNYILIRDDPAGFGGEYVLLTKFNGSLTTSSSFTILNESTPDQVVEIVMTLDQAEVYLDDVLKATNTTNVPNNAELKPLVRLTHTPAMAGDNILSINYIKIEQ